ncbi:MAG TPA: hypothetical protein VGB73_08785 [Pyrinomonadaceae bacterium]
MESGLNFTESLKESEQASASSSAVSDREAAGKLRAAELGMWLSSLQSFFEPRNHPLTENERAGILTRDFTSELRITESALMRCSSLLLRLTEGAATGEAEAEEVDSRGGASFIEGEQAFTPDAPDAALIDLSEAIGELWNVGGALVEEGAVGFYEWVSLGKNIGRVIGGSEAASKLMSESRRAAFEGVQPTLLSLAEKLTPDALATYVLSVFSQLSLLLARLQFVGALLRRDQPLKQSLPIFTLVHEETRELLQLIEKRALRLEGLDTGIFEALDGTAYAIRMELRKTFDHELVGLSNLRSAPALYAKVEAAHGLLRDSFQQSTVALAQVFNPTLNGARLFNAFQTKVEQSLALRQDLWALLESVRRVEQERERATLAPLLERLDAFQDGSMRHLMYKDWEAFERFADEVAAAHGAVELGPVLHRFSAYLETLFGQVNMRAVLADRPFDFPSNTES